MDVLWRPFELSATSVHDERTHDRPVYISFVGLVLDTQFPPQSWLRQSARRRAS